MEKIPTYPFTLAQKIDVAVFAGKNEKANIALLNDLNQNLYDLTGSESYIHYGRPIPQGFADRLTGFVGRLTQKEKTFDHELHSIEKLINTLEAKRKPAAPVKPANALADKKYKETVEKQVITLQKEWLVHCKQQTVIKKGTILYSGQYSNTDISFDQLSNFEKLNQGMWLTQKLDEAMSYATKDDDCDITVHGRQIFCFVTLQDIAVLEFKEDHHPALIPPEKGIFLAHSEVMTSRFDDVASPLIQAGKVTKQAIGHLRYAEHSSSLIHELWINKPDPKILQVKDIFTLPLLKKNTQKTYPDMAESKYGTDFALSKLKQFSSINDFEAWLALSHMAKTQSIDETHSLETLVEECGFTKLSSHIKETIRDSTNSRLVKLLDEHESLLKATSSIPTTQHKDEMSPEQTRKLSI